MFDIGWSEMFVIAVVALVVIGPKDLPKVMRTIGRWVGKAKRITYEFKHHVDDMMRESELDDVRRQIQDVTQNPGTYVEKSIDPDKQIREALEFGGEELVNVKMPDLPTTSSASAPATVGDRKETTS
jgi:sec-independent protein translocase protein TatB